MIYLDASVIVAIIVDEPCSPRARSWINGLSDWPILSGFVAAEVAAALSRGLPTRPFSEAQARAALDDLDSLRVDCENFWPDAETFAATESLVRDFRLKLSAPDALHLASAVTASASIATFDARLAEAARAIGVEVEMLV